MTFDLDLWHTDLNINRDHLLIKDYLPTKFEASEAKHSWVISCTRWSKLAWPLTLTFDLLTWISIAVIPHQGLSTYQVWSFWGKAFLSYQLHKVKKTGMTFDLLTWISIGVISESRTIYLPSLKLLVQSFLELSVCKRWSNLAGPFTLTFDLLTWRSIGVIYSSRTIYIPSLKLLRQSILELSELCTRWINLAWPLTLTFDLLTCIQ